MLSIQLIPSIAIIFLCLGRSNAYPRIIITHSERCSHNIKLGIPLGGEKLGAWQHPGTSKGSKLMIIVSLKTTTLLSPFNQDTAYNPLAVDEVSAQHISADCVVHYGRASLNPTNSLPAFFVFPKDSLPESLEELAAELSDALSRSSSFELKKAVLVIIDQSYQHAQKDLERAITDAIQVREATR